MPQFLIFDSKATVDSRGQPVSMDLAAAISEATAVRSMPIRLFGERNTGLQFVLKAEAQAATLRWFLEFYADNPSLQAIPTVRTWPGIPLDDPVWPWAREQAEQRTTDTGIITHYDVTRQFEIIPAPDPVAYVAARYFPISAYGLWARLAVWQDSDEWLTTSRLYVFATIGGYDQEAAAEASFTPWAGWTFAP